MQSHIEMHGPGFSSFAILSRLERFVVNSGLLCMPQLLDRACRRLPFYNHT